MQWPLRVSGHKAPYGAVQTELRVRLRAQTTLPRSRLTKHEGAGQATARQRHFLNCSSSPTVPSGPKGLRHPHNRRDVIAWYVDMTSQCLFFFKTRVQLSGALHGILHASKLYADNSGDTPAPSDQACRCHLVRRTFHDTKLDLSAHLFVGL